MKFLQRLFHWDADQSNFEKGLTVVLALFFIVVALWLMIASFGVGNSPIANDHRAGGSTGLALLFFILCGVWTWAVFSDKVPFKVNEVVAIITMFLLFALAILFNVGFDAHTFYPK